MNNITFRKAKLSDYIFLVDLAKEMDYSITPRQAKERLKNIINCKDDIFIVAELSKKVIGFVHGISIIEILISKTIRLGGLVVSRNYRKLGIGKQLMQEIENYAKKNRYSTILVPTNIKRVEAHKFYTKIGYKNEKTQFIFFKHLSS